MLFAEEHDMLLVLVALIAGVVAPSPMPTNPFTLDPATPAATLPTIGHTRSRAVCTAIHRSVIPALDLAQKNTATFTGARQAIFKYTVQNEGLGKDFVLFQLDQKTLAQMQKNLDAYDALLADPALVPRSAINPDDATLIATVKMRAQTLRDVENLQISTLSGFLETERMMRYRQQSETEQEASSAIGTANLPSATGDQKVIDDYYHYFHDAIGPGRLADAKAIDLDLGEMQQLSDKSASALRSVAADAIAQCH